MNNTPIQLRIYTENWPISGTFRISRGKKTSAHVVVVELIDDVTGRGESVPYARYGESLEQVVATLESVRDKVISGRWNRSDIQRELPAGAARNALDCAFWDLEARRKGKRIWQLVGASSPSPVTTAYTLSIDTPTAMGRAACKENWRPLLKIKLGQDGDLERVAAVRKNAPNARLIVDANEGWCLTELEKKSCQFASLGVDLIEQPLPAAQDSALDQFTHAVPLCADESCHTRDDIEHIASRYEFVNIKLDKTGGLTEALAVKEAAQLEGMGIMVGCMVGTSLSMAPAFFLAQQVDYVDLDGPLLLEKDRDPGLQYEGSLLHPPDAKVWG